MDEPKSDVQAPKSLVVKVAQIMSDVFSPITVPTYGMALAMWLTPLRVLPERGRLLATLLIFLITGITPLVAIMSLIRMGRISDNSISDKRQRPLPLLIAMFCYAGAGLFLASARAPFWLQIFYYGAALATAIATVITLWWKISAHTIAMGGLVGMMLWFAVGGLADVNAMLLLSIGILLAGCIATARLILQRHTLGQVIVGFFLGIICTFGLILVFYH